MRDALITVLGIVGILTVCWLIAAWAFSLSVIVFVTGSMSPTMPTGTAAIVQTVPAASLDEGDVVTVPRPDTGQPVTHRVVRIEPGDTQTQRVLSLKGDANDFVDSHMYAVTEAERVLVSVPSVGWAVLAAKTPAVMVTVSVLVAVAIAWAFWPTRPRTADPHDSAIPDSGE